MQGLKLSQVNKAPAASSNGSNPSTALGSGVMDVVRDGMQKGYLFVRPIEPKLTKPMPTPKCTV